MAKQRELFATVQLRSERGYFPTQTRTVVFGPDATITETDTIVSPTALTADTWSIMTPVAYDAVLFKWFIWTGAGSTATVDGFLIGATGHSTLNPHAGSSGMLQLDVALDVQGVVMLAGEVDYESIFSPAADKQYVTDILAAAGTVDTNLVAALETGPREKGIWITNLASAH